MKAHIMTNQNIVDENEELSFYISCYNALVKLENIYLPKFSLAKLINSINNNMSEDNAKTFNELFSLRNLCFAVLLGLKKEDLEYANSSVKQHRLFQYKDYEGDVDVYIDENKSISGKVFAPEICRQLNFNQNQTGPFPYMLDIIKDNDKNRPYDYVSKIRNAYLHAQYKLDKINPAITHIWNTDDNGNVIFEGKILTSTFEMFITDYFGFSDAVGSKYTYFKFPLSEIDEEIYTFDEFLENTKAVELEWIEIPEKYKFNGQKGGIYEQLNSCFDSDTFEIKDINDILNKLKAEGVKYNEKIIDIPLDKYDLIKEYRLNKGENYYLEMLHADLKLIFSPLNEIANCFTNFMHYIDFKTIYLTPGNSAPIHLLANLKNDENLSTTFRCAIAFLKLHLINYAIESKNINELNYDLLNLDDVVISNINRFNIRKNDIMMMGYNEDEAYNKLVLEIMRNALAHGGDRISVSLGKECKVTFTDRYQDLPEISVEISLDKIDEIFNVFNPKKIVKKQKVKRIIR